jgi:Ni2+-binding GTPase involved in maturation of urease and hydrogenase
LAAARNANPKRHNNLVDGDSQLIVENVGNLSCLANFNLSTHASVLIASVPEGDDKP